MTKKINTQDWEVVSAYIDDELTAEERELVEVRLEAEPELRALKEDLQHTRTLVKSLKPIRAPRDFTLTPAMAGIPERRTWAAPAFQWASAFVMVLFVLVIVGDFSGVLRRQQPIEAVAIQEIGAPTSVVDLELEAAPRVEEEALQDMGQALEAPVQGQEFSKAAPTQTSRASAGDSVEQPPAEPDAELSSPASEELAAETGESAEFGSPLINTFILRIIEAGLVITALLLALGALVLRRRPV